MISFIEMSSQDERSENQIWYHIDDFNSLKLLIWMSFWFHLTYEKGKIYLSMIMIMNRYELTFILLYPFCSVSYHGKFHPLIKLAIAQCRKYAKTNLMQKSLSLMSISATVIRIYKLCALGTFLLTRCRHIIQLNLI